MKELVGLDQVLEEMKTKSEESKRAINTAQKTVDLINKIIRARENLGLTQRDLAKKCGLQQPALARIESLNVVPKINTLIKIADAVGVNIVAVTPIEAQTIQMHFSISKAIINKTQHYNNIMGDYLWRQN